MKILPLPKTIILLVLLSLSATAQSHTLFQNPSQKDAPMHATGTFEVKLMPVHEKSEDKTMGKMTIEKKWQGDIEGTSTGEMLTGGDPSKGSAGYVAMEKMNVTLKGKKGTFILQHSGTMTKGEGQLTITVVPDSGTDQLEGLSGKMTIKIEKGKHYYDFDYEIKCPCE